MNLTDMTTEELLLLLKRSEIKKNAISKTIEQITAELNKRPESEIMWTPLTNEPKDEEPTVE